MATIGAIISRARLEIGDPASPFVCSITGDGVSTTLELSRTKVDSTTIVVTVNGVTKVQGVDYTVDTVNGQLLFAVAPAQDAIILAAGNSYNYFTDTDMTTFVNTAFAQHIYNRTDALGFAMTLTSLPTIEEYLIAILTIVEALWVLATSASFDIDISTPEGVHIPRSERFQQLSSVIAARKAQYNELAQALNVGLLRIEMFDLRRISRMTGKLVPIYLPQEYEDNRPPTRVFPPIDAHGGQVNTTLVEPTRVDFVALSNNAFSGTLSNLGNLTNLRITASIRPYPGNLSALAKFTVVITDTVLGNVTLSLTGQQTYMLSLNLFWDITSVDTSSNVKTLAFGTFTTNRQGQP